MTTLCRSLLVPCLLTASVAMAGAAPGEAPPREAKALFEKYVTLGQQFDPAVGDLYSDEAVIKSKRTYPTGQVRELVLPAAQAKALIRKSMPLAKARGDTSTYSDCSYSAEGQRVRIKCTRFSNLKKYSSPTSLLVGPTAAGWLILEELNESQP